MYDTTEIAAHLKNLTENFLSDIAPFIIKKTKLKKKYLANEVTPHWYDINIQQAIERANMAPDNQIYHESFIAYKKMQAIFNYNPAYAALYYKYQGKKSAQINWLAVLQQLCCAYDILRHTLKPKHSNFQNIAIFFHPPHAPNVKKKVFNSFQTQIDLFCKNNGLALSTNTDNTHVSHAQSRKSARAY